MEQQLEQLQLAEQQEQRDWASLPEDVLRLCLSAPPLRRDRASAAAAFRSCKAFARALVHTLFRGLTSRVDQSRSMVHTAQLLNALRSGEQHQDHGLRALGLYSTVYGTPGRWMATLLAANERLPFVRYLTLQGLSLNALLPSGISVLLPNLQDLIISQCRLTPAANATVLDAACSKLTTVQIEDMTTSAAAATSTATAQLKQLAKLPSISSITLDRSCPTLFLLALGTQLTCLDLNASYHQRLPGTETPAPGWKVTLQHVARCTSLQDLTIPCLTAEELGLVAPALQQLRALYLNSSPENIDAPYGVDGDAMMEMLLGLPHLTNLTWNSCGVCSIQRHYTDPQQHPCRWEELTMFMVSAGNLGRLPLHSLKQPFAWTGLLLHPRTPLKEARAAVANVTRGCPAGFSWQHFEDIAPFLMFDPSFSPQAVADFLVALQPLLATLAHLTITVGVWDVAMVKALAKGLPRTCTCLELMSGSVSREVLEQVASSMSWLTSLHLQLVHVSPQDVVQYVRIARSSTSVEGAVAQPALGKVKVAKPMRLEGMSEVQHRRAWEDAMHEVQRVSKGAVVLEVVWG